MNHVDHSPLLLGLTWIDLAILALALAVGFWGWRLGILRAGVALISVAVGVVLAGLYHERVFVDLAIDDAPSGLMRTASFGVILALASVGGYLAGIFLKGAAAVLLLGWADRAAGALFGVIFGLMLAQAAIAIVVLAGLDHAQGEIGQSLLGWFMLDNAPVVRALLPAEFDLAIQQFVADIDQWRQTAQEAAQQAAQSAAEGVQLPSTAN